MDSLIRTDVLGGGNPLETHFGDRVKIVPLSGNVFENLGEEKPSSIYMRGQVWYWEDPIYGKKEDNRKIHPNEGTIRYNRYVIILQDNLEQHDSLMVVPLSSTSNSSYDVEIEVLHVLCDNTKVYAKPRLTFPATKNSLKRYVCTLSNKDMNMISYRIAQLSMPAGITKFMGEQLKSFYQGDINISLYDDELYKDIVEDSDLPKSVVQELQYTPTKAIAAVQDLGSSDTSKKGGSSNKWTKQIKKNFVKLYDEKGIEYVMKKYGISKSTAYTYIYKFRDELKPPFVDEIFSKPETSGVDLTEDVNDEDVYECNFSNANEIPENCKRFAASVKRYFRSRNAYITYRMNGKKHKASKESPKFYDGIYASVLTSLMKFCFIDNKNGMPKLTINISEMSAEDQEKFDKCLNALVFLNDFNEITNDAEKQANDMVKLMEKYRNRYTSDFGIEREWGEDLYQALCKRLGSVNYNVKNIRNTIMDLFCKRLDDK